MPFPFGLLSVESHFVRSRGVGTRSACRVLSSERFNDGVIAGVSVEVGSEHVLSYQGMTHSSKLSLVPLDLTELGWPRRHFRASEEHLVMFG